jgi:hypothetical protein
MTRVSRNKSRQTKIQPLEIIKAATSHKSNPMQVVTRMRIPGLTSLVVPTTGIAAGSVGVTRDLIEDFTTRFQNCYEEYRILKCVFHITPLGINSGTTAFWVDENPNQPLPTANEALAKSSWIRPNSNANSASVFRIRWTARDFSDLTYLRTSAPGTPRATLQYYSDITNYGGSGTNTNLFLIRPVITFEFRGMAPVGGF